MFPFRLVTFDIDGTLTLGHGWRFLAAQRGRTPAYESTTSRYLDGRIGEDEHLQNLIRLAEGATAPELEEILERTPKLGHIPETVNSLHSEGVRVALLSHNPEYICRWYERRFGFDDQGGTPSAEPVGDGPVPFPGTVRADKPAALRRLLDRAHRTASETAHVGDSRSDGELFRLVGGGIALNSPDASVREAADAVVVSEDLAAVLAPLGSLHPRRV
ncbi:MAG: HAD-IB family phosphatase [Thermoplasmata archaeon]|nr:HAD-IB family phosphatase [Thermoplasmata archaeon]